MGLALFIKLTPAQRGAVILKDVLGHSLSEIAETLDASVSSIKGALHRGRASLRKLAQDAGEKTPPLDRSEANLLEDYVRHFVAQEFDELRELLARDVRLDVVGMAQSRGANQVGKYFHRYGGINDWSLRVGSVEGQPAVLVFNAQEPSGAPSYFMLIDWLNGEVARIRDYRYSRYVMVDAEFTVLSAPKSSID
jgi:RNA polymerase sigma-70 factor (ECF subfamily)